jgi:hypothetical protein
MLCQRSAWNAGCERQSLPPPFRACSGDTGLRRGRHIDLQNCKPFTPAAGACQSPDARTVQPAPLPFTPQFSPFPAYYLTYPYWHAILSRVCRSLFATPAPISKPSPTCFFFANPCICHTSTKSLSKSFPCHTSKNTRLKVLCLPHIRENGGGGGLIVNQIPDEGICPEEHRDEGSLFTFDEDAYPERVRRGGRVEGPLFAPAVLTSLLHSPSGRASGSRGDWRQSLPVRDSAAAEARAP